MKENVNERNRLTWGGLLGEVLDDWKISNRVRARSSVWGKTYWGLQAGRQPLFSSEELLKGLAGGQCICVCGKGVIWHQAHILVEGGWESGGTDVSINDFQAFLRWEVAKIAFKNFLWELSSSLLACCVNFPSLLPDLPPELLSGHVGG